MVTEKDIINMSRKIKRSKNPKTLAKYQIQIDAWIAELETAQAQAQADILALEEKIKMEEEARAAQNTGRPKKEVPISAIGSSNTPKEVTKKVAGPRKSYHYFEFERSHLRRSRF